MTVKSLTLVSKSAMRLYAFFSCSERVWLSSSDLGGGGICERGLGFLAAGASNLEADFATCCERSRKIIIKQIIK